MEKELTISTATVTIQLVKVDGKRMTKSVFNQIQSEDCFDKEFYFIGDSFLGYVIDSDKYLLWIKNGELRKARLGYLEKLNKLDIDNDCIFIVRDILRKIGITYLSKLNSDYEPIVSVLNNDQLYYLRLLQQRTVDFMQKLTNSQLYISI